MLIKNKIEKSISYALSIYRLMCRVYILTKNEPCKLSMSQMTKECCNNYISTIPTVITKLGYVKSTDKGHRWLKNRPTMKDAVDVLLLTLVWTNVAVEDELKIALADYASKMMRNRVLDITIPNKPVILKIGSVKIDKVYSKFVKKQMAKAMPVTSQISDKQLIDELRSRGYKGSVMLQTKIEI